MKRTNLCCHNLFTKISLEEEVFRVQASCCWNMDQSRSVEVWSKRALMSSCVVQVNRKGDEVWYRHLNGGWRCGAGRGKKEVRKKINKAWCLYSLRAHLTVLPWNPSAVMKMLMRTVKKTKTVAALFILSSLGCFRSSFRLYLAADTKVKHNKSIFP